MHFCKYIIILFLLPLFSYAQSYAIETNHLYSTEDNQYKGKSFIQVKNGIITDVSPTVPKNLKEKRINLKKFYVFPGLIDLHTHLLLEDPSNGADFSNTLVQLSSISINDRIESAKIKASQLLKAGFTTIRDLGNSGNFGDLELKRKIREGTKFGPRLFLTGPGICKYPCQFPEGTDKKIVSKEYTLIDDSTDIEKLIKKYKISGVNWIKLYADNHPSSGELSLDEMKKLIGVAHRYNLPVAVHAEKSEAIKHALKASADTIEHGIDLSKDILHLWENKETFFIPTDLSRGHYQILNKLHSKYYQTKDTNYWLKQRKKRFNSFFKLYPLNFAFGSDLYFSIFTKENLGASIIKNLDVYIEYGLSNKDLIYSMTQAAAKALKMKEQLGVIKKNSYADIIAFSENPIDDIRNLHKIVFIMKDGKIILNKTNTQYEK